jgi:hypothetical protein
MIHRDDNPLRARGPSPVPRISLAAAVIAVTVAASHVGHADSKVGAVEAAGPPSPAVAELRRRFAGFYRYAGDAAEQKAREEAIDRSVAPFFFAIRGMVRAKVTDRTRIMPTCRLECGGGSIRSTVPAYAVAVSPETGAPAPYRIDDDAVALSQRFEGARLIQVFQADEGGSRKNELALSADGVTLTMRATLSSPKLPIPVVYTLTYRREE